MTFQNKQEKLFFGIIHLLTKDDVNKRLSEEEIIAKVSAQVNIEKTKEIFANFSRHNIKYIHEDDSGKYRISDAGMVYYEQLDFEWKLEIQQKKLGDATISSMKWTKFNIIITLLLAAFVTFLQVKSCNRNKEEDILQSRRESQDMLWRAEIRQTSLEVNRELRQIFLYLQDTARVKVKIEK